MSARVLKPQPFNPDFSSYTHADFFPLISPFTLLMGYEVTFVIEETYEASDKCKNRAFSVVIAYESGTSLVGQRTRIATGSRWCSLHQLIPLTLGPPSGHSLVHIVQVTESKGVNTKASICSLIFLFVRSCFLLQLCEINT